MACAAVTLKCVGPSMGEKPQSTKKLPGSITVVTSSYFVLRISSLKTGKICTIFIEAFDNRCLQQVGKLKILCENFFKLKSIKPRLFLQEEVRLFNLNFDQCL